MKKLIIIWVLTALAMAAQAQVDPQLQKPVNPNENKMMDCYIMKEGKVWELKDNKSTPLDRDLILKNGSILKPEGTVVKKDGEIIVLNEGDKVYADGIIEKASSKKETGYIYSEPADVCSR